MSEEYPLQARLAELNDVKATMRGERYVARQGIIWRIRFMADANDDYWCTTTFERGIKAFVGTIAAVDEPFCFRFPPREVIADFPGFVGAKYSTDYRAVYKTKPDRITEGSTTYARCYFEQARALYADEHAREALEEMGMDDEDE